MQKPEDSKITACGVLVISRDKKILAFARGGNMNKLGLTAGKREYGENLREAAERELFEETGVKIDLNDSNDDEIFYFIPDDKNKEGLDEYCATYIVRLEKDSEDFTLAEANKDEHGIPEGIALWVAPDEFIKTGSSAFINYNTELLKFAGLVK